MTLEKTNVEMFKSTKGLVNLKNLGIKHPIELGWNLVELVLIEAGYGPEAMKTLHGYPVNIVVETGTLSVQSVTSVIFSVTLSSIMTNHGNAIIEIPDFAKYLAKLIKDYGVVSFVVACKKGHVGAETLDKIKGFGVVSQEAEKILNKLPELDEEETGGFQMTEETNNTGPVNLRDAKALYQKVYGTTTGSIYKVAAVTEKGGLKFACKFSGSVLSTRVEGPHLMTHAKALQAAGFSLKGEKYGSVHVNVSTTALAAKTLGALLFGLGLRISTPIPQYGVLFG